MINNFYFKKIDISYTPKNNPDVIVIKSFDTKLNSSQFSSGQGFNLASGKKFHNQTPHIVEFIDKTTGDLYALRPKGIFHNKGKGTLALVMIDNKGLF